MSEWLGPSWGQFTVSQINGNTAQRNAASARRDSDHNYDVAQKNAANAEKWREHTEKLRIELDRVWDMYQDKSSAERGQTALKDAALLEIDRMDPVNKMLSSNYRQKIYDEARQKYLTEKTDK